MAAAGGESSIPASMFVSSSQLRLVPELFDTPVARCLATRARTRVVSVQAGGAMVRQVAPV